MLFLAFLLPYFLRSTILGSLVRKPSFFKTGLFSSSFLTKALDTANLIALCLTLQPTTVYILTLKSNLPDASTDFSGCSTISLNSSEEKYLSRSELFILKNLYLVSCKVLLQTSFFYLLNLYIPYYISLSLLVSDHRADVLSLHTRIGF